MKIKLLIPILSLYSLSCIAVDLDSAMTREEQKKTGYSSLKKQQKKELNAWLTKNMSVLEKDPEKEPLSLNININGGRELVLSDGSKWEVAPQDQEISGVWLTPIPLKLLPSGNPDYPNFLVNVDSDKERVRVKPIP